MQCDASTSGSPTLQPGVSNRRVAIALEDASAALGDVGILHESERDVALVFWDLALPELDGRALLAMPRADYRDVGAIMMSRAITAEEIRSLYPDDEKAQFLAKPFSMADLAQALLALGPSGSTEMDSEADT